MSSVICERTCGNASVAAIDEYDRVPRKTGFANDNSGTNIEDAPTSHPPVDIDAVFGRLVAKYDDVLRQLAD